MLYDLLILGGGPAGYHAAEKAGHAGLKTLLFEKNAIGGVCLNEGCIPSKTLLNSAKILDSARNADVFGVSIDIDSISYNQAKVVARKNKIVKKLGMGIKTQLKNAGVEIVNAHAQITGLDGGTIKIIAAGVEYQSKNVLLATGSQPVIPPIEGLAESIESGFAVTNKGILELEAVPGRLIVIGAGVIGLEMAAYYRAVGSKVSVIETLKKIAGAADGEISSALQKNLEKKGVEFKLGCAVKRVSGGSLVYSQNGEDISVEADCVLVSTGRCAVNEGLGLENVGVELNEKGFIKVDESMKTNISGIYAAGDVTGKLMLAHTAYRQAEAAVNSILGIPDVLDYPAIPSVIYTSPEVGSAGLTEEMLIENGIEYEKKCVSMNFSGRYAAEVERGDGFCKLLFGSDKTLLGVHIIGQYASEIIMTASVFIQNKCKIEDIEKYTFPHPSIVELIKLAL